MNSRAPLAPSDRSAVGVRAFFQWWRRELSACVPASFRDQGPQPRRGIVLTLDGDSVRVATLANGRQREQGAFEAMPSAPEAERRSIAALIPAARLSRSAICLALPDARILRKRMELPAQAESDIDSIIANQIDRLTPYRADQVRCAHLVVARDRLLHRLTVEVIAITMSSLAPALERMHGWGLSPAFLWVAGNGTGEPVAIDLRPKGAARPTRRPLRLIPTLAMINALLLALAVGLPLWQQHAELARLDAEVATARSRADAVLQLRRKIEALRSELAFLSDSKVRLPVVVTALNELTRIVPDGTWIEELRIGDGQLDLRGQSPHSAALIGRLESSPMFASAAFRAPVTRQGPLGMERFHLGAKIDTGGAP